MVLAIMTDFVDGDDDGSLYDGCMHFLVTYCFHMSPWFSVLAFFFFGYLHSNSNESVFTASQNIYGNCSLMIK